MGGSFSRLIYQYYIIIFIDIFPLLDISLDSLFSGTLLIHIYYKYRILVQCTTKGSSTTTKTSTSSPRLYFTVFPGVPKHVRDREIPLLKGWRGKGFVQKGILVPLVVHSYYSGIRIFASYWSQQICLMQISVYRRTLVVQLKQNPSMRFSCLNPSDANIRIPLYQQKSE